MTSGIHLKAKGKWKEVTFTGADLSVFDDEAFSGLISMQELTDYEVVGAGSESKSKKTNKKVAKGSEGLKSKKGAVDVKGKTVDKTKLNISESSEKSGRNRKRLAEESLDEPKKKKRRKKQKREKESNDASSDGRIVDKSSDKENCSEKKQNAKKQIKKRKKVGISDVVSEVEDENEMNTTVTEVTENNLPGWKGMFVPSPVLRALKELGFTAPTPIQALTLPSAIRDRQDIVGGAETGSGKTLSFGIPLIHHILEKKSRLETKKEPRFEVEPDDLSDIEIEDLSEVPEGDVGSTDTSDNEEFPPREIDDESDEGVGSDEEAEEEEEDVEDRPLYALILTPTRELAIQVRDHIQNAAKYTNIRVTPVVGGISMDKQRRLLRRRPEIVVATPGRLWELMQEGNHHLSQVPRVPYLVIDECDRMVQKGHFEELSSILELMNNEENAKTKRQTFVFSATLTFVHDAPNRFKKKKKLKKLTSDDKLQALMTQIGIKAKPKVVDLTKKMGTAETLTESKIHCSVADKDVYLYYFLQQFPGRTLVFTNSKDCLRRLLSILTLLQCNPLPLHADMHQKQRLKNLERFTKSPKGLLLATDVAARGLDIPDVQHVIHFQVPQTTENYIHRSGRTARAYKEGLSFMIVGPDDIKNYRKILRALKRTEDIPQLPVDLKYLPGVRDRVNLAKSIDAEEHKKAKVHHHNNWFLKAAKEMDIELEDDLLKDTGDSMENSQYRARVQGLRSELKSLLRVPVISQHASHRYPTMSGKLVVPYMASDQAIDRVKSSKPLKISPSLPSQSSGKAKKKNKKNRKK